MCLWVVLGGKLLEFVVIIILLHIKEEITFTSNSYYSEFVRDNRILATLVYQNAYTLSYALLGRSGTKHISWHCGKVWNLDFQTWLRRYCSVESIHRQDVMSSHTHAHRPTYCQPGTRDPTRRGTNPTSSSRRHNFDGSVARPRPMLRCDIILLIGFRTIPGLRTAAKSH